MWKNGEETLSSILAKEEAILASDLLGFTQWLLLLLMVSSSRGRFLAMSRDGGGHVGRGTEDCFFNFS